MLSLLSLKNKVTAGDACVMPHMDRFNERKEWSFVSHVFILIKVEPVSLKILELTVTCDPTLYR